jgi:hypothetical protein
MNQPCDALGAQMQSARLTSKIGRHMRGRDLVPPGPNTSRLGCVRG